MQKLIVTRGITVHGGDFRTGGGHRFVSIRGVASLRLRTERHRWFGERIDLSQLETLEHYADAMVKTTLFTSIEHVTFIAKFKDGRRLFATSDQRTFARLQAAVGRPA